MLGHLLSDDRLLGLIEERGLLDAVDDEEILTQVVERAIAHDLDEETLVRACEANGITRFKDPVEELDELPDTAGTIYHWTVPPDEVDDWIDRLNEYEETVNGLDALHVVLGDADDIRQVDLEELQQYARL